MCAFCEEGHESICPRHQDQAQHSYAAWFTVERDEMRDGETDAAARDWAAQNATAGLKR